jgi:hypothetical protein
LKAVMQTLTNGGATLSEGSWLCMGTNIRGHFQMT